ncbi:extracellular solute-binding protein [Paenibacillus chartarius]|uniref:Extracellular solute-binding protein n=1 Tax=Paenibacillus chartarius TaxID=747481 RepID=A0ABV6DVA7_9BACL
MKLKIGRKRQLAGILVVCLLHAACSRVGPSSSSPDSSMTGGESAVSFPPTLAAGSVQGKLQPVTFSLFVNYDWYSAPMWSERPQAKWISDNFKVSVVPIQSNGAASQKLNTMIVSGELPEVIVTDRGKDVERLQKMGKLVALDPYLEKYPEFVRTVGEKNLNMLRSEDGKLYQIPNWFINGNNGTGNAAFLVQKKVYQELGSPKLETWDDLEAYAKLVKSNYPDMQPLEFGEIRDAAEVQMFGFLYSGAAEGRTPAFISPGAGQVFGVPIGDRLTSIYQDPAFRDAALEANRLYRAGVAPEDLFTETRDQILEKLMSGKIAVFGAYDAVVERIGREANNLLQSKDADNGYQVIPPLHKAGVDGSKIYPSGYYTTGWNVNVITTSAKNPEAIFAYMNWASSPEGQRILFFGPPGLFYDKVENGVPIPNEAYLNRDSKKYDELRLGEFNWNGNTTYIDSVKTAREKLLPRKAQDWTTMAQAEVSFKTSMNLTAFSNLDPAPGSEEGIILQHLKEQFKRLVPKLFFASGENEVLSLIQQADQEAARLGYDKVLKWKEAKWHDNERKLSGR